MKKQQFPVARSCCELKMFVQIPVTLRINDNKSFTAVDCLGAEQIIKSCFTGTGGSGDERVTVKKAQRQIY